MIRCSKSENHNITVIYNAESKDILYTIPEVAEIIKTNPSYVHKLRKWGILPFLKIGQYKCRRNALLEFLERYEGKDITDPFNIKELTD